MHGRPGDRRCASVRPPRAPSPVTSRRLRLPFTPVTAEHPGWPLLAIELVAPISKCVARNEAFPEMNRNAVSQPEWRYPKDDPLRRESGHAASRAMRSSACAGRSPSPRLPGRLTRQLPALPLLAGGMAAPVPGPAVPAVFRPSPQRFAGVRSASATPAALRPRPRRFGHAYGRHTSHYASFVTSGTVLPMDPSVPKHHQCISSPPFPQSSCPADGGCADYCPIRMAGSAYLLTQPPGWQWNSTLERKTGARATCPCPGGWLDHALEGPARLS